MLLTCIGLVIFSVVLVFSVSNTKYHILCTGQKVALSHIRLHMVASIVFLVVKTLHVLSIAVNYRDDSKTINRERKRRHQLLGLA